MAELQRHLTGLLRRRGHHGAQLAHDIETGTLPLNRKQEEHLFRVLQHLEQENRHERSRARLRPWQMP